MLYCFRPANDKAEFNMVEGKLNVENFREMPGKDFYEQLGNYVKLMGLPFKEATVVELDIKAINIAGDITAYKEIETYSFQEVEG